MSDDAPATVRIRRLSRITTDERGRSVWADPVDSAELELVSTQMLKQILTSRDPTEREAIEAAADTAAEGVLVRHADTGGFEIIEDDELQAILDHNQGLPKLTRPADVTIQPLHDYADDKQMSLVSTQALRKVLDLGTKKKKSKPIVDVVPAGFDPYNHG